MVHIRLQLIHVEKVSMHNNRASLITSVVSTGLCERQDPTRMHNMDFCMNQARLLAGEAQSTFLHGMPVPLPRSLSQRTLLPSTKSYGPDFYSSSLGGPQLMLQLLKLAILDPVASKMYLTQSIKCGYYQMPWITLTSLSILSWSLSSFLVKYTQSWKFAVSFVIQIGMSSLAADLQICGNYDKVWYRPLRPSPLAVVCQRARPAGCAGAA